MLRVEALREGKAAVLLRGRRRHAVRVCRAVGPLAIARPELFLLLVLRRYEKSSGSRGGASIGHTTGVVRLKKSLDWEFYPGVVNALHEMKY